MKQILISQHRQNDPKKLSELKEGIGAEIDLRTENQKLILSHDPFLQGNPLLVDWLKAYGPKRMGYVILNVKEDLLEEKVAKECIEYGIKNFFFIDVAFPTVKKLSDKGFKNLSLRVSEFESLETVKYFQGKVEWIWLDCFTGRVPEEKLMREIQDLDFRIALVSPELHGYGEEVIRRHLIVREFLRENVDLVCTKRPELWMA